jgi:hypothetical protein
MPFVKGDPRINRNGRPRKEKNVSDDLDRIGRERTYVTVNGKRRRVSNEEALYRRIYFEAMQGTCWAARMVMEYTHGRPISRIEGGDQPIQIESSTTFDYDRLPIDLAAQLIDEIDKLKAEEAEEEEG